MSTGDITSFGKKEFVNSAIPDTREVARVRIVWWVFVIYGLLIFEGALRKWIFPDLQQLLFFVRDPFALWVYLLAIRHRAWYVSPILIAGLFLAVAGVLIAVIQLAILDLDLSLVAYGWRNYFFYIPLAFVIGANFRRQDLYRLFRFTLYLAIPIAILTSIQAVSPADAIINQGTSDNPENVFDNLGVAFDVVRAHGTFTSIAGQTMFIGTIVAMILATLVLSPNERPISGLVMLVVTAAVVANLAVSGSRGAFVLAALITLGTFVSGFVMRKSRGLLFRAYLIPALLVLVAPVGMLTFFSETMEALWERTVGASALEGVSLGLDIPLRIIDGVVHPFYDVLPETPIFGIGLGMGGNAASRLGTTQRDDIEDDWSRNIVELGPVLGLFYILFRITLVVWLARGAFAATKRTNNPIPLLLFFFVGVVLFNGQITAQGSINGYAWLFAGFCIAANRLGTT
jgi:hypothetical protein